jgi:hypothetical protein
MVRCGWNPQLTKTTPKRGRLGTLDDSTLLSARVAQAMQEAKALFGALGYIADEPLTTVIGRPSIVQNLEDGLFRLRGSSFWRGRF